MAGEVTAEAVTTVGGAAVAHQEQRAVAIVVDKSFGHQVTAVTDGIGGLVRKGDQLSGLRDVLGRNRIGRRILRPGQARIVSAHSVGQACFIVYAETKVVG